MAIGLQRTGYAGLLAAWIAFTLPSAILLVAFAYGASALRAKVGVGWIQGLKAQLPSSSMRCSLRPGASRRTVSGITIALTGMILAMLIPGALAQVFGILVGGAIGLAWLRHVPSGNGKDERFTVPVGRRTRALFLCAFFIFLLILPLLAVSTSSSALRLVDGFYRAGSLVFGGGRRRQVHLRVDEIDAMRVHVDALDGHDGRKGDIEIGREAT